MAEIKTIISEEERELWQEFCEREGKSGAKILRDFSRKYGS